MIGTRIHHRFVGILLFFAAFSGAVVGSAWYIGRREAITDQRSRASGGDQTCDVTIDFAPPVENTTPTPTLPLDTPLCRSEVDVAIVIDRSGSMTDQVNGKAKLEWAKEAATAFVNAIAASNVQVGISVVSFGSQGNDGTGTLDASRNSTRHIGVSEDYGAVREAIAGIRYTHSGTCIACGLRIGTDQVVVSGKSKAVILLSDGGANHIWDGTKENAHELAIDEADDGRSRSVEYQVIGIGSYGENSTAAATLKAIAGTPEHYAFRPDPTQWAETFLSLIPNVCE